MRYLLLFVFYALTTIALKAQTPSIEALRTCAAEKGMSPKEYIFKQFGCVHAQLKRECLPKNTYSNCLRNRI